MLRHAKSDWAGDEPDVDRPLGRRGLRQAPLAGQWLAGGIRGIDLAVVSPARRARDTWELASAELVDEPPTLIDERAYAASSDELLGIVRGLSEDAGTVVLVGHNPGIEDLASLLADESVPMPTSAIAVLALPGPWSTAGPSSARLVASGRPPTEAVSEP
ncbi:histidine phosphatase family protein [Lacisediminihabitans profunda]|uniref:Histidine phosphatase family protein n=1 Tax=Lacisediminihabitans profunda TaxID=2594790 RepID=A0A5C8USK9_9MICO|nr:histidine phosphatase family protein [Lacisediminihabitans profunda]